MTTPDDPRELARTVTKDAFDALVDALTHPEATIANRIAVALALRGRGWGKPAQPKRKSDLAC
jgi:hypothetical protein